MDTKHHIGYVDIAKGIGIILVVLGHTKWVGKGFIYQFHMALFFFLSGITYNEKYDVIPIKFFLHKTKKLYLAFLFYFGCFILLHNCFVRYSIIDSDIYMLKDFIAAFFRLFTFRANEEMGGALWFLRTLLFSLGIFNILRFLTLKCIKKNNINMDIILLFFEGLIYIIGYYTNIDFGISGAMVASMFVFWGYEYKKYERFIKLNVVCAMISACLIYYLSLYTDVSMGANKYTNIVTFLISSFLGIYLTTYVSKFIETTRYEKILEILGKSSMTIMALHFLAFKVITKIYIMVYNLPSEMLTTFPVIETNSLWCFIYTLVGVGIPTVLREAKQKIINNKKKV